LNKYHYSYLTPAGETDIANTTMHVTAFPLSHSNPYLSTAFLVRQDSSYLLYLGDTGADTIEKADNLRQLWQAIAPLVKSKKLKALFVEVSFPNKQPANQLFGHLTPTLLMHELQKLAMLTGKSNLKGFNVIITHMKPAGNGEKQIQLQLQRLNTFRLHLIFPQQGKLLQL
jgi:cAMP phosphodiesterase